MIKKRDDDMKTYSYDSVIWVEQFIVSLPKRRLPNMVELAGVDAEFTEDFLPYEQDYLRDFFEIACFEFFQENPDEESVNLEALNAYINEKFFKEHFYPFKIALRKN